MANQLTILSENFPPSVNSGGPSVSLDNFTDFLSKGAINYTVIAGDKDLGGQCALLKVRRSRGWRQKGDSNYARTDFLQDRTALDLLARTFI